MRTVAALALAAALAACSPSTKGTTPGDPGNPLKVSVTGNARAAEPQTVDYYFALDPDCEPEGYPVVRIIAPPQDGTLAISLDDKFSVYGKDNARFACNKKKSPVTVLTYQPRPGYVGKDDATVEVVYPLGGKERLEYTIEVH